MIWPTRGRGTGVGSAAARSKARTVHPRTPCPCGGRAAGSRRPSAAPTACRGCRVGGCKEGRFCARILARPILQHLQAVDSLQTRSVEGVVQGLHGNSHITLIALVFFAHTSHPQQPCIACNRCSVVPFSVRMCLAQPCPQPWLTASTAPPTVRTTAPHDASTVCAATLGDVPMPTSTSKPCGRYCLRRITSPCAQGATVPPAGFCSRGADA